MANIALQDMCISLEDLCEETKELVRQQATRYQEYTENHPHAIFLAVVFPYIPVGIFQRKTRV